MSEKPAPPIDTDVSLIEYKTEKKMCSDVLVNCNFKMPGKAALTMREGLTSQKRMEIRDTGREFLMFPHPFAVTSDFDGVYSYLLNISSVNMGYILFQGNRSVNLTSFEKVYAVSQGHD